MCRHHSPTQCSTARRRGRIPRRDEIVSLAVVLAERRWGRAAALRTARAAVAADSGGGDGGARNRRPRCRRRPTVRGHRGSTSSTCSTERSSSRTTSASTWRCSSTRSRAQVSTYRPDAAACTLEAFRLVEPLADNHRLQSICERHGIALEGPHEAMSDVLATAALLRLLLDDGLAPETVELDESAYHRLRARGDTRPASEPQIRRVFGMARSAGLLQPSGGVDRDQVVALVNAHHRNRRCRLAHARPGAGRLRRARRADRGAEHARAQLRVVAYDRPLMDAWLDVGTLPKPRRVWGIAGFVVLAICTIHWRPLPAALARLGS